MINDESKLAESRGGTSERVAARFLMSLARALHYYGMPSYRVEHALAVVAAKLGVEAQFLVTPTSIVSSVGSDEEGRTVLARLDQGQADLSKLAALNELLRDVFAGETDADDAAGRVAAIFKVFGGGGLCACRGQFLWRGCPLYSQGDFLVNWGSGACRYFFLGMGNGLILWWEMAAAINYQSRCCSRSQSQNVSSR